MARNNSVELVISAKNETDRTFEQITEALNDMAAELARNGRDSSFFDGIEKKLKQLKQQLDKTNAAIADVTALKKAIASQQEFIDSIEQQAQTVTKAQRKLAELQAEFADIERAANQAREPNDRLTASLAKLTEKQGKLGEALAIARRELEKSNEELIRNQGLDERSIAAIQRQEAQILDAGKAWRQLTKDIAENNKAINSLNNRKTDNEKLRQEGEANLVVMKKQLDAAKQLNKEFQKQASRENAGEATRSLARSSAASLNELVAQYDAARRSQADLNRESTSLTAALRREQAAFDANKAKAAAQKKLYDELKKSLAAFTEAQRQEGTNRQKANIDRLTASLSTLEERYNTTAQRITAANQAIAEASSVDPRAIARRDAYLQRIQQATQAVQREQQELAELRVRLESAGISSSRLATRQAELDRITENLTADQRRLEQQLNRVGDSANNAGGNIDRIGGTFNRMGGDTRTTLSYLQRIKGELLAIAATYGGIYAVGGAIKSIYDTSVLFAKAESRFSVFFKNDATAVEGEVEFIKKLSDDLKLNFEATLDEYSKFISGMDATQVPLDDIRKTFEGFATAARVGRISTEDFSGVMRALTQIFSKQKLSSEELRQQIGDRLPGAVKRTADALKISTADLEKAMEQGNVSYEAAILLANNLYETYSSNVAQALNAPDAALEEFRNTMTEIRKEIADGGFIDILTQGLKAITAELKKPEIRQGILDLVNGFSQIIKLLINMIQYLDELGIVLALIFGAKAIGAIANFGVALATSLAAMTAQLAAATAAGSRAAIAMATLRIAFVGLQAALVAGAAGFGIGTYLYAQSEWVQKAAAQMVGGFDLIARNFSTLFKVVTRELSIKEAIEQFKTDVAEVGNNVKNSLGIIEREFANKDKIQLIDPDQTKKDAEKAAAEIAKALFNEDELNKLRGKALAGTGKKLTQEQLDALRSQISDALTAIDKEIQEKSGNTLQERLDAINLEYDKLLDKLSKAKAAGVSGINQEEAKSKIAQVVAIKQVQEAEKEINRLIEDRRKAISEINELQSLGSISAEEANKRILDANKLFLPQMDEALAKAQAISDKIKSVPISQSVGNLGKTVDFEKQRATNQQLLDLEKKINDEMSIRAERIQTVNALVELGTYTELQGKEKIAEINQQTQDQTRQAIDDLEKLILANQELSASAFGQTMLENIKQYRAELGKTNVELISAREVNEQFANGLTDTLLAWKDGFTGMRDAFRSFISDFLIQIAKAIMQAAILKALTSAFGGSTGGIGGVIMSGVNRLAGVNHTGGIVGQTGTKRMMPVTAFANAVKYHSGGIAGLKPNEVPTILQKGEEVLTRNDPRHQLNGGNGGNSAPMQVKIVNAIDSVSVLKEALNSSSGRKVLVNAMRADKSSFKTVLA